MLKPIMLLAALLFLTAQTAHADQLAWVDHDTAKAAADRLKPGTAVASYCSQCDDHKLVVGIIKSAEVLPAGDGRHFKVKIVFKPLLETAPITRGQFADPPAAEALADTTDREEEIDLAYIYIPDGKSMLVLGKAMALECDVVVERFTLAEAQQKLITQATAATKP